MTSPVGIADLNRFTVKEIERTIADIQLSGSLTKPGQASRGQHMSLFLGMEEQVEGQLTKLDPDARSAVLTVSRARFNPSIVIGTSLPMFDSYWSDRVHLALDTSIQWTHQEFHPRDAFEQPSQQGGRMWCPAKAEDAGRADGRIVRDGWDHEHCELCWQKIGHGGQLTGYVSSNDQWVCRRCYETYVARRDLSFVVEGAGDGSDSIPEFQQFKELIDNYDLDALRTHVERGGNVNVPNRYGWTPLMIAALRGHLTLLSLLLSLGADVNAVSLHGCTALANAAQRGHYEAAKILLSAGATVGVPDSLCGGSLLTYIKTGYGGQDSRIVEILTQAGAK